MVAQVQLGAGNVTKAEPAGTGTTLPITAPPNLADADLLIAAVIFQQGLSTGTGASCTSPGWTRLSPNPVVSYRDFALFGRPIPSESLEPADYTFTTVTAAGRRAGIIARITGADLDAFLDAAGVFEADPTSAKSQWVLPELTTIEENDLLIAGGYTNNAAATGSPTFTPPGSMVQVERAQTPADSNLANTVAWLGVEELSASGATGTRTVPFSLAAANAAGVMVAIKSLVAIVFDPIESGTGSLADRIMAGLVSQGFTTGSLSDRERARLLSKLDAADPGNWPLTIAGYSLYDLYREAGEDPRI